MYPEYKLGWFLQLFMFQVPSVKFFLNRMESNSIKFSVSLLCFFLFIASLILCSSKFTAEFLIYFPGAYFCTCFCVQWHELSCYYAIEIKGNLFGHNINVLKSWRHHVLISSRNPISDNKYIIDNSCIWFIIVAGWLFGAVPDVLWFTTHS